MVLAANRMRLIIVQREDEVLAEGQELTDEC